MGLGSAANALPPGRPRGSRLVAEPEIAATIRTLLLWAGNSTRADAPIKLLANFWVLIGAVPIALLLIEIDCGWTFRYAARSLSCTHYGGKLSAIVPESAAIGGIGELGRRQ